jgi:hypothetical protein
MVFGCRRPAANRVLAFAYIAFETRLNAGVSQVKKIDRLFWETTQ